MDVQAASHDLAEWIGLLYCANIFLFSFFYFPQGVWRFYRHAVVLEFGFKDFHCRVLVEVMNAESETVE